jgi:predicted membrane protein
MTNFQEQSINYDDYINTTAIFGSVRKSILSKYFKGGTVTNVFGETKIDLANADIYGAVVIDVAQLFGEVKVWVPANWHVIADVTNLFAEVKDKRMNPCAANANEKVLVLKGTSFFGVVKIMDCF